jgi:hypothetical protein
MSPLALCLMLLSAILPASLRADPSHGHMTTGLPPHRAEDAAAAVVTEENLLASERFWPYQVALTKRRPPTYGSGTPLRPGALGILIRVETTGVARLDFGRDGLHEVSVGATDLVERANRIRLGELDKQAPNFLLAVGPRLLDSGSSSLRPFPYESAAARRGFLCVFADPGAGGFDDVATTLAPLRERPELLTILFPQGAHPDGEVGQKLRSLEWTVPFLYDHISEGYTRSLLAADTRLPALMLQTAEGRVLFQSGWRAEVVPELSSALDAALDGTPGN